jgi:hypothetical protein
MNKLLGSILAAALLSGTTAVWAEAGIQQKQIQFAKGKSGTTVNDKIKGDATIDYRLGAKAGQTMTVDLSGKSTTYFNVLPPGSDGQAIFIGQNEGGHYQGELPADGIYTLRVYQMGAAKSEGKENRFTLKVGVSAAQGGGGKAGGFAPGSYAEIVGVKGDLDLLSGPSMGERVTGHVGEGRLMQVLKCEPNDGLWCEVEARGDKSLHGWVKGRNLRAK